MKFSKLLLPCLFITTAVMATNAQARRGFIDTEKVTKLTDKIVSKYATTSLDVSSSKIYFDNDESFQAKLDVIDHSVEVLAKTGSSELFLNYYIFNKDESSSYLATKLIDAAKRGVKVYITLDMLQAYPRLDYYRWMKSQSDGNMEFYFYGRPTKAIMQDAVHMASACIEDGKNLLKEGKKLSSCTASKVANIKNTINMDDFSATAEEFKLPAQLLSGIYAKNPKVMIDAILKGNQITLKDLTGDGDTPMDDKTKESLKEFLQLVLKSKFQGGFDGLMAGIKLKMALQMYGEDLQPLYNMITGLAPFTSLIDSVGNTNKGHKDDWAYITDYTHHKLILSNDKKMVLGGRNIENSYHMQANKFSSKYIFMDTDMGIDLNTANEAMSASQKDIHNFKALVISMDELLQVMPNDLAGAMSLASQKCELVLHDLAYGACTQEKIGLYMMNPATRISEVGSKILVNAGNYESEYKANVQIPAMEIDQGAKVSYLENLHFKRNKPQKRILGVEEPFERGKFASSSKAINELWIRGMVDQCRSKEKSTVYLYNAYFFPSANFITTLAKMIDGTYKCKNVEVKIITNSIETTDLGVINIFARHWLKSFSDYYLKYQNTRNGATVSYYEYNKEALKEGAPEGSSYSLHSKVSVFGDSSFIIGSANADIRSYARDTNNAAFVTNAPQATAQIVKLIEDRVSSGSIVKIPMGTHNMDKNQLKEIDKQTLAFMNARRCIKKSQAVGTGCEYMNPSQLESATGIFLDILAKVDKMMSDHTFTIKTYEHVKQKRIPYTNSKQAVRKIKSEQRRSMDQYDFAFGVL